MFESCIFIPEEIVFGSSVDCPFWCSRDNGKISMDRCVDPQSDSGDIESEGRHDPNDHVYSSYLVLTDYS